MSEVRTPKQERTKATIHGLGPSDLGDYWQRGTPTLDDTNRDEPGSAIKRPRRSVVLNSSYWGHDANTSTKKGSLYTPKGYDDDDDWSDTDTDESVSGDGEEESDEEITEEAFNQYLESMTPEEVETGMKIKSENERKRADQLACLSRGYNHQHDLKVESYFEAPLRMKYRKEEPKDKPMKTMTPGKSGKERGRKPRKGNRTGQTPNEQLPEKPVDEISVSQLLKNLDTEVLGEDFYNRRNVYDDAVTERLEEIRKDFPEWMFLLREGFNIMLHGYGSKEEVLEEFKTFLNDEYLVVYINGLFPGRMNPKKLLQDLCRCLHVRSCEIAGGSNVQQIAEDVKTELNTKKYARVFILVKNIEMLAVKNPAHFQVICLLSEAKSIHLIACCDHVNSFVDVDQTSVIALNLWWIICPTFAPYDGELQYLKGAYGEGDDNTNTNTSLQHIFQSLTVNAKKAFRVLASLQLEISTHLSSANTGRGTKKGKPVEQKFEGVPFRELARRCQQDFISHSDQGLTALLTEFVDHKLITYTGKRANMTSLTITLENSVLEQALKD